MKGMYDFLSRGLACLAVALVILCVLAMPTQEVRANDPGGGPDGDVPYCDCVPDIVGESGTCYGTGCTGPVCPGLPDTCPHV